MKNFMYTIVLCGYKLMGLQAQTVNIPDANFKQALLNHAPVIDTNNDGRIPPKSLRDPPPQLSPLPENSIQQIVNELGSHNAECLKVLQGPTRPCRTKKKNNTSKVKKTCRISRKSASTT